MTGRVVELPTLSLTSNLLWTLNLHGNLFQDENWAERIFLNDWKKAIWNVQCEMSELLTWLANCGLIWRLKIQKKHNLWEQQWLWECEQAMSSSIKYFTCAEFESLLIQCFAIKKKSCRINLQHKRVRKMKCCPNGLWWEVQRRERIQEGMIWEEAF